MQIFFSHRYIHSGGIVTNMLRFEINPDTMYEATRIVEPKWYDQPSDDGDKDIGFNWYRTCSDRNVGYETEPVTDLLSIIKRYAGLWYSGKGEDLERAKAFLRLLNELNFKNNRHLVWDSMTDSTKDEFRKLFFFMRPLSLTDKEKMFVDDHLYKIVDRFWFLMDEVKTDGKQRIVRMINDYNGTFKWKDANVNIDRSFLFEKGKFYFCKNVSHCYKCFELTGYDGHVYLVPMGCVENGEKLKQSYPQQ